MTFIEYVGGGFIGAAIYELLKLLVRAGRVPAKLPTPEVSKVVTDLDPVWERCALACVGGSERRQCPCDGPANCIMRNLPDFEERRDAARRRIMEQARKLTEDSRK